jgi:hypothetical protein
MNDGIWLVEAGTDINAARKTIRRSEVPLDANTEFYATWIGDSGDGLYFAPWVIWDVDSKTSIGEALRDARGLVATLRELGAPEQALRVVYSTGKGFHVYLDSQCIGLVPSEGLHGKLKRFCMALLPTADDSMYSKRRIVGVPNSLHRKTGRRYVSVPIKTFDWITVPMMDALSTVPQQWHGRSGNLSIVPALRDRYVSAPIKSGGLPAPNRLPTRWEKELATFRGVRTNRNIAFFELAAKCRREGMPIEIAGWIVVGANRNSNPSLDQLEIEQIVNNAYQTRKNNARANTADAPTT